MDKWIVSVRDAICPQGSPETVILACVSARTCD